MPNELVELNERASKLRDYIKRNPRYCSGEESELEDLQQLIRECQIRGSSMADAESEGDIVY
jgi:hypothetical protein